LKFISNIGKVGGKVLLALAILTLVQGDVSHSPAMGNQDEKDERITLYHGSVTNAHKILTEGLDMRGSNTYTSTDKRVAQDAIKWERPDVQKALYERKLDRGIIASDIPKSEFLDLASNGSIEYRQYQGFDGANLQTIEVVLMDSKAKEVFNRYRRPDLE